MGQRPQRRAQRANWEKVKPGVNPDAPEVVKGCTGKTRGFISKKRALAAAADLRRRTGRILFPYRCLYCRGRFHLSSSKIKRHVFAVASITLNGRRERLWEPESVDDAVIESFVDQLFALVGLSTVEYAPEGI